MSKSRVLLSDPSAPTCAAQPSNYSWNIEVEPCLKSFSHKLNFSYDTRLDLDVSVRCCTRPAESDISPTYQCRLTGERLTAEGLTTASTSITIHLHGYHQSAVRGRAAWSQVQPLPFVRFVQVPQVPPATHAQSLVFSLHWVNYLTIHFHVHVLKIL